MKAYKKARLAGIGKAGLALRFWINPKI